MRNDSADMENKLEPVVLYEDDDVVVIDKPHGMLVHEDRHSVTAGTVVDWFLRRVPTARGVGEITYDQTGNVLERSGVVHRLDRDTSGVMILAKTAEAHTHLKKQFHDRLVKKEYRALVYGKMNERWGTITRQIGRSSKDARLRSAEHGAKGTLRDAHTDWECIGSGAVEGELFSYLLLKPKTGRTHQLRVHLRAIDRPIVGDTLYSTHKIAASHNLGLERLALHAHILEIALPNGQLERFTAPVPLAFEQATKRIAE